MRNSNLAASCYRCHGEEKQEGNLRLDSADAVLKGGDSGPAVVPGDARESPLINAVSGATAISPHHRLEDAQIAVLAQWINMGVPWSSDDPLRTAANPKITDQDRAFWAFQPVQKCDVPRIEDGGWSRNAIDKFIYRKLLQEKLVPASEADRLTLVRRAYFDLIGLPPTLQQLDAFLSDDSPRAYEALIERLLASPHYGEKWARHWLDLVRYAESHGHGNDQFRPDAFRYRDYVVRAFNEDKPYDRFVSEQLAGDEIAPEDPDALIATGFLRHWIYESNQRKVRQVRQIILDDVTEVTGEVFLAMGMGCARCHDHKFDPILRKDYYRLQAFFAPLVPRNDVAVMTPQQMAQREPMQTEWEALTAGIREQIDAFERPLRQKAAERAFKMFPQEIKDIYRKPRSEHTPLERQLVALVDRQLYGVRNEIGTKLKGEQKQQWDALQQKLARFDQHRPEPVRYAMVVTDVGPVSPPTIIPGDASETDVLPGFLSVLDSRPANIDRVQTAPRSTGRRTALARWIVSPNNPLSTRVIVNRIWQYHFGRGLVATSSDFGRLGEEPTHPELLDWLARRFVQDGWSFKQLHRLIMTSATYRQSSLRATPEVARQKDPDNRWLWRMNIRRLDAEQIRDAMLAVSAELDPQIGGPSVETTVPRRTIYTKLIRNTPDPLLRVFDAPDGFESIPLREVTTTATQALMMVNGPFTLQRARAWARHLRRCEPADTKQRITMAFRSAFGHEPGLDQLDEAAMFLEQQARRIEAAADSSASAVGADEQALTDFCHVLLNSNEFLYVD